MYNIVYRWVWNSNDAIEIVQEAFLKLWQVKDTVEWETAKPYVYKIALNKAANVRRFNKFRSYIGIEKSDSLISSTNVEESAINNNLQKRCRDILEYLPNDLREVLVLSEFSEMSYAEIAKVLNIPAGTVGSKKNRAIAYLKKAFPDVIEED